jgi:hypothetical protein
VIVLLLLASACVVGIAASIVMSWASNRSALWNMMFSGALVFGIFVAIATLVIIVTRRAFG